MEVEESDDDNEEPPTKKGFKYPDDEAEKEYRLFDKQLS